MKRSKKIGKGIRKLTLFALAYYICFFNTLIVQAGSIRESKLAQGTEKLITDATTWLLVLAPIVGGLLIIYFCIRRSAADEMDQKKWNNRIVTAIISCIGAVIGSAMLNILISYYK